MTACTLYQRTCISHLYAIFINNYNVGHITCIPVLILQKQRELEFVIRHMDESDSMIHVS